MPPSLTPCSAGQRTEGLRHPTRLSISGQGRHRMLRSWETPAPHPPGWEVGARSHGSNVREMGRGTGGSDTSPSSAPCSTGIQQGKSRGGSQCCTRPEPHRGKRGPRTPPRAAPHSWSCSGQPTAARLHAGFAHPWTHLSPTDSLGTSYSLQ